MELFIFVFFLPYIIIIIISDTNVYENAFGIRNGCFVCTIAGISRARANRWQVEIGTRWKLFLLCFLVWVADMCIFTVVLRLMGIWSSLMKDSLGGPFTYDVHISFDFLTPLPVSQVFAWKNRMSQSLYSGLAQKKKFSQKKYKII